MMSTEKEVDATPEEWQAEEERWDKEQAAIPGYDEAAARDADDQRQEAAHEKSVEDGTFNAWEKPEKPEKPAFVFEKSADEHER